MEKSKKVKPKVDTDGTRYVVFNELPKDQQIAWKRTPQCYTARIFSDRENEFCPYYRDYENFYNNWLENKPPLHLD